MTLHYCIQCTDSQTGKRGTFGYDKAKHAETGKFFAVTEVFPGLYEFFQWAHAQGYVSEPGLPNFTMRLGGVRE